MPLAGPAPRAGTMRSVNLREHVSARARIEGELILVDEFLNHKVDPIVMAQVGVEMANHFRSIAPELILTAEASGIPPAMACSAELGIPMVYAKKYLGVGNRYTFAREVTSPTKGVEYRVEVARRVLAPGTKVAIVDDFLSRGRTAEALGEIAVEAGCELLGFGFVIEKSWMEGRGRLERHGWNVASLVDIAAVEGEAMVFRSR